jgi:hypothetical protein
MDLNVKRQIDENAKGYRNKAVKEMVAAALPGLIVRHQAGQLDAAQIAKDAVAIAKLTIREMMLEKLL